MRILVYGDSNSWGYLDDGSGQRYQNRWPVVMAGELAARGMPVELVEECLPGRTTSTEVITRVGTRANSATGVGCRGRRNMRCEVNST